jgi:hypothetical protein
MRATLDQHGRNGRLATGDAARQSYPQHWQIRIIETWKPPAAKERARLLRPAVIKCPGKYDL